MPYPNDYGQAGNYTAGVGNANEYVFHPGVCVLPLAEDPPTDPFELATYSPVVTLRLHAPFRTRVFTQASGKERNPPPIAAPGDTGAFVFLGGNLGVKNVLNTTYQDYDWAVGCEYTYVEACTPQGVNGEELGLVLGKLPFDTVIDQYNQSFGYSPPAIGAASLGGRAVTTGYNMAPTIVLNPGTGELKQSWSYNAQAFYPAQLFYTDLPNGGKPVATGG